MNPPTRLADPAALAARIRRLSTVPPATSARPRVIIGITGAPGAGKSSLAQGVVAACGPGAVHVGMDGFHLSQAVLDNLGLSDVKGAPETFDAPGYLALLERLNQEPDDSVVYAPEFRRSMEEPIAGAVPVPPSARVIVTEGNYLLLDTPPWDRVRPLLTEIWFLDTPEPLRIDRLVRRHIEFGRTPGTARERATSGSDGRNAALVLATRVRADLVLRP